MKSDKTAMQMKLAAAKMSAGTGDGDAAEELVAAREEMVAMKQQYDQEADQMGEIVKKLATVNTAALRGVLATMENLGGHAMGAEMLGGINLEQISADINNLLTTKLPQHEGLRKVVETVKSDMDQMRKNEAFLQNQLSDFVRAVQGKAQGDADTSADLNMSSDGNLDLDPDFKKRLQEMEPEKKRTVKIIDEMKANLDSLTDEKAALAAKQEELLQEIKVLKKQKQTERKVQRVIVEDCISNVAEVQEDKESVIESMVDDPEYIINAFERLYYDALIRREKRMRLDAKIKAAESGAFDNLTAPMPQEKIGRKKGNRRQFGIDQYVNYKIQEWREALNRSKLPSDYMTKRWALEPDDLKGSDFMKYVSGLKEAYQFTDYIYADNAKWSLQSPNAQTDGLIDKRQIITEPVPYNRLKPHPWPPQSRPVERRENRDLLEKIGGKYKTADRLLLASRSESRLGQRESRKGLESRENLESRGRLQLKSRNGSEARIRSGSTGIDSRMSSKKSL